MADVVATLEEVGNYLMVESLNVQNFRCFRQLELHGLRRINIVVGDNASGKTALLESIRLGLVASPNVVAQLNQWRGMAWYLLPNPTADQFRSAFLDLFHNFNDAEPIVVSAVDSGGNSADLRVYYDPAQAVTAQQPLPGFPPGTAIPGTIIPLAFQRTSFQGEKSTVLATVVNGQVQFQPAPELGIVSQFFSGNYFGIPQENAQWLSRLSIEKKSAEVTEAMRRHFPFLRDVSAELQIPGIGAVYADISPMSRKLPLSLVSAGVNRLLTMILATVTYAGGVVLVDEIENGIFHTQLPKVWQTMVDTAQHHNTQLFISTHSKECLQASLPTVAKHRDDFTLLRTRKEADGSTIDLFSGADLEAALEKGGEVRDN